MRKGDFYRFRRLSPRTVTRKRKMTLAGLPLKDGKFQNGMLLPILETVSNNGNDEQESTTYSKYPISYL